MILSVSRRTDIPAFYSEWFYNRIREGYVLVRNPRNPHRISKISLLPEVVDGIVLWTKNPSPMIDRLDELEPYSCYFQFTLNAYGTDVEPSVPSKNDVVLPAFQKLSRKIGRDRVVWRYDPILFSERYSAEYHLKYFRLLAAKLSGYTETCTVSFLDFYRSTERNTLPLRLRRPAAEEKTELMQRLSETAKEFGIAVVACSEDISFAPYGVLPARCIDPARFERLTGYRLSVGKDPNQRPACGCAASIDIGAYDTCGHGCLYCYANHNAPTVWKNRAAHNPSSPLLLGEVGESDVVTVRSTVSCKDGQLMFDE